MIQGARPGSLVIDCSTISPQVTKEIAAKLAEKGVHMLDAPISGGSEGAANGTLSIMVGGGAEQFERAMPVFEAMGKTITHVGDTGAGQTVKLVNQILVVGNCLAMCEALMLAQAGGVDLKKTFDAVSKGAAGSWMFTNRGPANHRPGLAARLHHRPAAEGSAPGAGRGRRAGRAHAGHGLIFNLYRTLEARGWRGGQPRAGQGAGESGRF